MRLYRRPASVHATLNRNLSRDLNFGDGQSLSATGTAYFPVVLSGRSAHLPVSILDALLGVNILNECGAIVHFGRDPGIWSIVLTDRISLASACRRASWRFGPSPRTTP